MSHFLQKLEYNQVPQDATTTEDDGATQKPAKYLLTRSQVLLLVIITAALSSAFTAVIQHVFTPLPTERTSSHNHQASIPIPPTTDVVYQHPPEPVRIKCGTNAQEAIALNCTYDALSVAWLPSYCPLDHLDDFKAAAGSDPNDGVALTATKQWRYFYDDEGKDEMAGFDALSRIGIHDQYRTTVSEHRWHCAFMLMRVHSALLRARRGDLVMDATTLSAKHAKHCIFWLAKKAKGPDDDKLLAHGQVAYGSC